DFHVTGVQTCALPILLEKVGADVLGEAARQIVLFHIDRCWTDHLAFLTDLREGIHLRALGRMNPLDEFHRESVTAYRDLLQRIEIGRAACRERVSCAP